MKSKEIFLAISVKYVNTKSNELWSDIESAYSTAGRAYHTISHLDHMFTELETVRAKISDWETVAWSVFYHDFVYEATRTDNEERSALSALKILNSLQVPFTKIMKIQSYIVATKLHEGDEDGDLDFFLDADLSVLGAEENEYTAYSANIRKEYSIYSDNAYNAGRRKVLEHFLSMKRIFRSPEFFNKYENSARKNLQDELDQLSGN